MLAPSLVGIVGVLVNGAEYFLLGLTGIICSVLFYIFFKKIYGGLYVNDPIGHPINEGTGLAQGDIPRIGIFAMMAGGLLLLGSLFLTWYMGSWGEEYYLEAYGSGIMSNFWGMIHIARYGGIGMIILGALLYFIGVKKDPFTKE